jgi:Tfp pilus assembly protein PilX
MNVAAGDKKGLAVIAAILIVLIASLMGLTAVSLLGSESWGVVNYINSQEAFFIAEGGVEYYAELLQNQSSSWTTPPTAPVDEALGKGTFTITTANALDDEIDVTSTSKITAAGARTIKRAVTIHIARGTTPDAYSYILYTASGINTTSAVNLTITGEQEGSGSYFPLVDFSYYQAAAAPGQNISGNYTFTAGIYTGIWYIDGNVTIDSGVTMNGTIVSTKKITSTNKAGITINPASPNPALIANNAIDFNRSGTVNINGLIYAGTDGTGSFDASRTTDFIFTGTIISPQEIDLSRSEDAVLSYDSSILTDPPPGITGGSSSITRSNWDEVY